MTERRTVVIRRKNARAFKGDLGGGLAPPQWEVMPLLDALEAQYAGEALITTYAPADDAVVKMPRLALSSMWRFKECPDEGPQLNSVAVDIDYENHEVPPDDWHEGVLSRLPADLPAAWYRTPHGLRLVFLPSRTMPIIFAADYIEHLHLQLRSWGVATDFGTRDWTRLQYAPFALGRDLPFDFSQLKPMPTEYEKDEYDPQDLMKVAGYTPVAFDGEVPKKTPLKKQMGAIGKTPLGEQLYAGHFKPAVGDRHAAFMNAALQICFENGCSSPEVPYALLGYQWSKYEDKQPAELWRMCEWAAARQLGSQQDADAEEFTIKEAAAMSMDCKPEVVTSRLVLNFSQTNFVYSEHHEAYMQQEFLNVQLPMAVRDHCPTLAPNAGELTYAKVLGQYATPFDELVLEYSREPGILTQQNRIIKRVGALDPSLEPAFHGGVAAWLEAIGGDATGYLLDWLSCLPEVTEPICALWINGEPGIGKQLLANGIARLWSKESQSTPYEQLTKQFNPSLIKSPLIWADESVPADSRRGSTSTIFRSLVGAYNVELNEKFKSPRHLQGSPRILITSNNSRALTLNEDLTTTDLQALSVRLGYIKANHDAQIWLQQNQPDTAAWVKQSIAEHILWLNENHEVQRPGKRFLIDGWPSEVDSVLQSNVGFDAAIALTVLTAIDKGYIGDAVRYYGCNIYVSAEHLANEWETILGSMSERPPLRSRMIQSLQNLSGREVSQRMDSLVPGRERIRYWTLPGHSLLRLAHNFGLDADELADIIERPVEEELAAAKGVFTI